MLNVMLSLFDYLGYPAKNELGKKVYNYAKFKQAVVSTRHVETKKYNGLVMLYTKELLDEFFDKGKEQLSIEELNTELAKDGFKQHESKIEF